MQNRTYNKYPNVAEYAKDMEEEITAEEATCTIKRMKGTEGIVIGQIEHNIVSQFANDTDVLFFQDGKGETFDETCTRAIETPVLLVCLGSKLIVI